MAFTGLPYYGYCPYTVAENNDGTETETFGSGKLTRAVINFKAANSNKASDLWAGDRMEQHSTGVPTAAVTLERSYMSLEEEAEICGHTYSEDGDMVVADGDEAVYLVCGKMSKLLTPQKKVMYRVEVYHRVSFDPVDDDVQTAEGTVAYNTVKLSGVATVNADGKFKFSHDYTKAEYATALAKLKELLHVEESET